MATVIARAWRGERHHLRMIAQRAFLGSAATLLIIGGAMHALAFSKAASGVAASNLSAFFAGSLKGLWLADSATMFIQAVTFVYIALYPGSASRLVVALMALIPLGTAICVYGFLGPVPAVPLLSLVSVFLFLAAVTTPINSRGEQR